MENLTLHLKSAADQVCRLIYNREITEVPVVAVGGMGRGEGLKRVGMVAWGCLGIIREDEILALSIGH